MSKLLCFSSGLAMITVLSTNMLDLNVLICEIRFEIQKQTTHSWAILKAFSFFITAKITGNIFSYRVIKIMDKIKINIKNTSNQNIEISNAFINNKNNHAISLFCFVRISTKSVRCSKLMLLQSSFNFDEMKFAWNQIDPFLIQWINCFAWYTHSQK